MAQAFLWGVAGGAGFAGVEGLFNSLLGISSWAQSVLLRIPATALHCFAGGLMGLAWHAAVTQRRRLRGLGLYAAAVSVHGLWNAASIGSALLPLAGPGSQTSSATQAGASAASTGLEFLLIGIFLGICAGLVVLTRYVRLHSEGRALPAEIAPIPSIPPSSSSELPPGADPPVSSSPFSSP
jgi:hypothetical protein